MARRFDLPPPSQAPRTPPSARRGVIPSLIGGALLFASVGLGALGGCGGPERPLPGEGEPPEVTRPVTEPEPEPPPPPRPPVAGDSCDPGGVGNSYQYVAICDDDGVASLLCADEGIWLGVQDAGEFACDCTGEEVGGQTLASCAVPGFVGIARAGRNREAAVSLRATV